MNSRVKIFIEENIDLIEYGKWGLIYESIYPLLGLYSIGEFTQTMLEANINPLNYMDYIPMGYLYGSNISEKFVIPNSVKSIGELAFAMCSSLTNITIPDSVTSIGNAAFYSCSSLTEINMPDSVKSIGDEAFRHCSSLTSINISNSVTSIGDWTFLNCSKLTGITIPDSVKSIGNSAFSYCTDLTNITIPDSVTSIGDWAFYSCKKLKDIYYGGTKEQWQHIDKVGWIPKYQSKTIHCSDGTLIEK